jgi:hypothetical protein
MGDTTDDVTDRPLDTPAAVQRGDGADAAPDRSAGDDADCWVAWTDTGGEG